MYCCGVIVGKAEAGGTPGGGDAPGGPGVLKAEPGGCFKGVCVGVDMLRASTESERKREGNQCAGIEQAINSINQSETRTRSINSINQSTRDSNDDQ